MVMVMMMMQISHSTSFSHKNKSNIRPSAKHVVVVGMVVVVPLSLICLLRRGLPLPQVVPVQVQRDRRLVVACLATASSCFALLLFRSPLTWPPLIVISTTLSPMYRRRRRRRSQLCQLTVARIQTHMNFNYPLLLSESAILQVATI